MRAGAGVAGAPAGHARGDPDLAALRESEARYRALFEHSPDALVVFDLDQGRFVDANRNAERLFGLGREALLATGPVELSPPTQPDGRVSRFAASAFLDAAMGGDAPEFEWTHCDARGGPIPCRIRLVRLPAGERRLIRGSITDLTRYKRAERDLHIRDAAIRGAANAIAFADLEGRLTYGNPAFCRLWGLTEDRVAGRHGTELWVEPEGAERALAELAERGTWRGELDGRRADGTSFPVEVTAALVRDAAGAPLCLMGVLVDLSERRAAERVTTRLARLYSALIETNQAMARLNDREALFHAVCRIAVEKGGLRAAWIGIADPATRRVVSAARYGSGTDYLERVRISTDPDEPEGRGPMGAAIRSGEHRICNDFLADPTTLPWHAAASNAGFKSAGAFPLRQSGEVIGALSMHAGETMFFERDLVQLLDEMAADISFALDKLASEQKLRASEARFRSVVASLAAGVVMQDATGRIVLANEAAERMLGLSRDELYGLTSMSPRWRAVREDGSDFPGKDHPAMVTLATGRPQEHVVMGVSRPDGSQVWLEINAQPMRDPADGTVVAVITSFADVTARVDADRAAHRLNALLERRVSERTAELQAAYRELESFSYSISHDLRAPLRAIDAFSALLAGDEGANLGDAGRSHVGRIRGGVERMSQMIDDLLELSRVTRTQPVRARVDASGLVEEIVAGLRTKDPARRVHVTVAPGIAAHADPGLLRNVLENLLSNAWCYTSKRDDAHIEFGCTAGASGERTYHVRDDGAGFDMAYTGKLFNAFQRLHSDREFPGHGIGLATVRRIVERHGGRIWAEGAVGAGATFFFTLGPEDRPG